MTAGFKIDGKFLPEKTIEFAECGLLTKIGTPKINAGEMITPAEGD